MHDLIDQATELGLRVVWRDTGQHAGLLAHSGHVFLNPHRTRLTQRTTLAHEMGHWWHGHDWRRRHDRDRDEREADTYAARLLISPAEYALAEQMHGPHPGGLAKELGVTRRLILLWQAHYAVRLPRAV